MGRRQDKKGGIAIKRAELLWVLESSEADPVVRMREQAPRIVVLMISSPNDDQLKIGSSRHVCFDEGVETFLRNQASHAKHVLPGTKAKTVEQRSAVIVGSPPGSVIAGGVVAGGASVRSEATLTWVKSWSPTLTVCVSDIS